MRFHARCKRLVREERASEIAEAALILPLVFMLLIGIIWFGRAFNIYSTITYAAREGARVGAMGATSSCATCSPAPPTAGDVSTRVIQVLQASHIDPGNIATYSPTPTPAAGGCGTAGSSASGNVRMYTNVQLNPGSAGPPACGVVVSFEYKYQFYFPFTSLDRQAILLKAAGEMPAEN